MHQSAAKPTFAVTVKQVEDWMHRLEAGAHEASDEAAYALESDLLDLRDELRDLLK